MRRYPFPTTPTGWYQVAYSDELPIGGVLPLAYFGRELVAWRDEAGRAHVLDAYCPHLGAHLGIGGRVDAGCLRCPFHGWRYDASGACASAPGVDKIPPTARTKAWPVDEQHGMVLVWTGDGEPAWRVPSLDDSGDGHHAPVRRDWTIRAHVQEVVENTVDGPHFAEVHGVPEMPRTTVEHDGPRLRAVLHTKQDTPRGRHDTTIETTLHGLGVAVLRFRGVVDTLLISAQTPIDDERFHLRFALAVTRDGGVTPERGVGAAMIAEICRQLDQDVPIWEHKIYREQGALAAIDAPLAQLRRWARQFY